MKQIILVGIGGAAGSILRFAVSKFMARFISGPFPLSTFIVNITGCFLIGLLMGSVIDKNVSGSTLRLLLATGFCGGYTTFSAFSFESLSLLNSNNGLLAAGYIFASVLGGIVAVWAGLKIA